MKKEASLPVRLDADVKARLKTAADGMGITPSALIRMLVRSFVDEYERNDGNVVLPPRWRSNVAARQPAAPYPEADDRPRRIAAESPVSYHAKQSVGRKRR